MLHPPQDNLNSVSSIRDSWTGKICVKDRDEVFPAHGTTNEPAWLKLDHLCLSDAKVKYTWICTSTPPCEWVACTGSTLPSFCNCWTTGNVCLFFLWILSTLKCTSDLLWLWSGVARCKNTLQFSYRWNHKILERRLKTKDSVLKPKYAGDYSSKICTVQNLIP